MRLPDLDLTPGERYSRLELRERFDRGRTPRGIEICYDDAGERYIRLFATEESRYDDEFRPGGRIRYVGEDRPGDRGADQTLSGGNEALAESADDPVPIFLFRRETRWDEWLFIGRVRVVDYGFVERRDRRVLVFDLEVETSPE